MSVPWNSLAAAYYYTIHSMQLDAYKKAHIVTPVKTQVNKRS
jgi:hypothetical protein